jgi:prophage regulatory protein
MHTKSSSAPTILRRHQVQQRTGLSRSTLYQYIKDGDFPTAVQLGPRGGRLAGIRHQRLDHCAGEACPPWSCSGIPVRSAMQDSPIRKRRDTAYSEDR